MKLRSVLLHSAVKIPGTSLATEGPRAGEQHGTTIALDFDEELGMVVIRSGAERRLVPLTNVRSMDPDDTPAKKPAAKAKPAEDAAP